VRYCEAKKKRVGIRRSFASYDFVQQNLFFASSIFLIANIILEKTMFYHSAFYDTDLDYAVPFAENFSGAAILITGATGLIGTFLVDALMRQGSRGAKRAEITVYALGRNEEAAHARFGEHWDSPSFNFIKHDNLAPLDVDDFPTPVDFIIHGAANAHPALFSTAPINTVIDMILGAKNVLDFASTQKIKRTIFISSGEVYGENRGDCEHFREDYCGTIACNSLRAGYPESKRCIEALCQAYHAENGIDVVIARLCHIFGATQTAMDSRVSAQWLRCAAAREDIIMKSAGTQVRSYCYVADAATALLTLLARGEAGAAYNVANSAGDEMSLREIAEFLTNEAGTKVIHETPSATEKAGYSPRDYAVLDSTKIRALGWSEKFSLRDGLYRALAILRGL
jgi:nucleoside-diphosphate-sugar epimerase